MADSESDLETDGLESALDALYENHCRDSTPPKSKEYCSSFCKLVEEYTSRWQVPLPQLKVLRTALCCFTKATSGFPDDCQHIHHVLSSLALSFFELMLFFSKEEFGEKPLKDILDSYRECHSLLLRHRNVYMQHVKQIIKSGGPWEPSVLQAILKETEVTPAEVEQYLSSELPIFLELRIRYLQACERLKEAMVLAKGCLENHATGKHLYFHQAYLTCLYKASLHDHLHKEMADIDGRVAVEIICNTETVEKDDVLLSLCKAFLTQQLTNGDMYYIWDLVFIWSRLHLRAHPSREGFLAECLQLASSVTNVKAIFPFIKLVTAELGGEGVQVCVELCARALELCDKKADNETRSLICKTIAFLLPLDLEICRACALLVFCQERSLEAYKIVCLLYMHPDQEPHLHNSPVRTNVRFNILQMLKEHLCFDPEFWNLLTLRNHCLELMPDKDLEAAALIEMKDEDKDTYDDLSSSNCINNTHSEDFSSKQDINASRENRQPCEEQSWDEDTDKCMEPKNVGILKKRKWKRRRHKTKQSLSDEEIDPAGDPEVIYNFKPTSYGNKSMYSLRHNHTTKENAPPIKSTLNRKREYLSRCVKSQIFKRKGHRKRWLQGLQEEQVQMVKVKIPYHGKKRGRKPLQKYEVSYPDNEIFLLQDDGVVEEKTDCEQEMPLLENELALSLSNKEQQPQDFGNCPDITSSSFSEQIQEPLESKSCETLISETLPAGLPAHDASLPGLSFCSLTEFHTYSLLSLQPMNYGNDGSEPTSLTEMNGIQSQDSCPKVKDEISDRDKAFRSQRYAHLKYHCTYCRKDYKGLNIMRHAIAHLKKRKRCIICGKGLKLFQEVKSHMRDHITEMYNRTADTTAKLGVPTENGIEGNVSEPSRPEPENHQLESNENTIGKTPIIKVKSPELEREERILKNVRYLMKKRTSLSKNQKNPSSIFSHLDIKDEHIVIEDGVVFIRNGSAYAADDKPADDKPAEENGHSSGFIAGHLCPSPICDKVFLKIGSSLLGHAVRVHVNEEHVLEKVFLWSKKKCPLCTRLLTTWEHFKDHMDLHRNPLPFFCYQSECDLRFPSLSELNRHVNFHKPYRPRCPFPNCEQLFANQQSLYDHEWRHYTRMPQTKELELGSNRKASENSEAPWKQRVKIEELWTQKKLPSHVECCAQERSKSQSSGENPAESCHPQADGEPTDKGKLPVNGVDGEVTSTSIPAAASSTTTKELFVTPQSDSIDVKAYKRVATLAEGVQQKIGEPHITEHKSFKPDDPSYAPFVQAPFVRPPPTSYLDESRLSMRRRTMSEELIRSLTKKEPPPSEPKEEPDSNQEKVRHRCDKCLTSFSRPEDLESHRSQNACSSLFGFDSDDES
ncbi:zinc finger protein 654 [Neosynchiropus ocellatus]